MCSNMRLNICAMYGAGIRKRDFCLTYAPALYTPARTYRSSLCAVQSSVHYPSYLLNTNDYRSVTSEDEMAEEDSWERVYNEIIESMMMEFIDNNHALIDQWIKLLEYKTFDAVEMRKSLEAKINSEETSMLCSVGIQVGNNFGNLFPSHLANLQRRLKIKKRANNDYKAVTLPRIMACFPEVTINLVHKQDLPMIAPYQELKMIHPEFPIIATTQVAAAVLPSTLTVEETCRALDLILVSQLKISEKSRCRDKKWMETDAFTKAYTISQYVVNSYKSKVLSDGDKSRLAVEYEIVSSDGGLSRAWAEAGAAAKEWLNDHYEYDVGQGPKFM